MTFARCTKMGSMEASKVMAPLRSAGATVVSVMVLSLEARSDGMPAAPGAPRQQGGERCEVVCIAVFLADVGGVAAQLHGVAAQAGAVEWVMCPGVGRELRADRGVKAGAGLDVDHGLVTAVRRLTWREQGADAVQ